MRADQDIKSTEIVNEAERLFSLDQPSLRALSYILRHRETWPKGFVWDFNTCESCAMGLADALWKETFVFPASSEMSRIIKMDKYIAARIFGGNNVFETYGVCYFGKITPEMVADQIDKYLAGVK